MAGDTKRMIPVIALVTQREIDHVAERLDAEPALLAACEELCRAHPGWTPDMLVFGAMLQAVEIGS